MCFNRLDRSKSLRRSDVHCSYFVPATQTQKMDEDNGTFLPIFLINCQSNCCRKISFDATFHIKDLVDADSSLGSIWGRSCLHIITIIIWTWKERNKQCTTAKERPWSQSICIRHLVPLDVWTSYHGALWLDSPEIAGALLMHKTSTLSPIPLHILSHSLGGTRGQSTLLLFIAWEASTAEFISRELGHSKSFLFFKKKKILFAWNLFAFCVLNVVSFTSRY